MEDSNGSKYTLDITGNDLKVEYIPSGGNKVEKIMTGLATVLSSINKIHHEKIKKDVAKSSSLT